METLIISKKLFSIKTFNWYLDVFKISKKQRKKIFIIIIRFSSDRFEECYFELYDINNNTIAKE